MNGVSTLWHPNCKETERISGALKFFNDDSMQKLILDAAGVSLLTMLLLSLLLLLLLFSIFADREARPKKEEKRDVVILPLNTVIIIFQR